ncbi:MAG: NUDIX hydrolase [Lachnospiraceae bacterium]|nr:NUDIX hydrolase [Lachnospiraceae bacterium]
MEDYLQEKHVERIDRKLVHKGSILDIYEDEMLLPDGKHETWDFVAHRKGAAAVLAVREDGKLIMVRQYRPALDRWTLEIPAGCRDSLTEDTAVTAERELEEETGYHCEKIQKLLSLKTTVAFCNEFVDVYLAEGLKDRKEQKLDEAEVIRLEEWDLPDLIDQIQKGIIQDSKTVSAVLAYQVLLNQRNGIKS